MLTALGSFEFRSFLHKLTCQLVDRGRQAHDWETIVAFSTGTRRRDRSNLLATGLIFRGGRMADV